MPAIKVTKPIPGSGLGSALQSAGAPAGGSFKGAPKGATLADTTNGILYINTGTAAVPVWTKVGAQV